MTSYGITGTKKGLTREQDRALITYLQAKWAKHPLGGVRFRHGDCLGADVRGAEFAKAMGFYVIAHPPLNSKYRAFFENDETLPMKSYLDRDRDVVDACVEMVACPKGMAEERRSGTWATIRYTRLRSKPLTIIWPDGSITTERYELK